MRTRFARVAFAAVLLAGVFGAMTLPAHADPGGPFNAGDNRISPMTGDRIAVYCNNDNVQIYGLDALEQGFPLTTFTLDELTRQTSIAHQSASGAVSLKLVGQPVTHYGYASNDPASYGLIVDTGTQYDVTWSGFDKVFSCTYLPLQGAPAAK